jgi:PHD/YefM family antitoxin component YafN of YafNO toxin-antitoxin module
MIDIKELNPEFITDKEGNKKAVVLSISDFRELMEDLEDLAVIAERRDEPTISHEDLLVELKNDGLL